jgi:hypothetical protein
MHRRFDNQIIKKNNGSYYKIFVPAWYQFWKWFVWLFSSKAQIKLKIDGEKEREICLDIVLQ